MRLPWDFPRKDHWDFTGSTMVPHYDVLTHPYQQYPHFVGYGSNFPSSNTGMSPFITNDLIPTQLNTFGTMKKGGNEVIPVDSMSGDVLVRPVTTHSKNASGKRKRQGTSDPKDPASKKKRHKKALKVSTTSISGESINNKNLTCKRKMPQRKNNEPHFSASHRRVWLKHYEDFREYVRLNGHGLIPHDYHQNKMLARWVKRQVRHEFRCIFQHHLLCLSAHSHPPRFSNNWFVSTEISIQTVPSTRPSKFHD
jgi:hypothetical protein